MLTKEQLISMNGSGRLVSATKKNSGGKFITVRLNGKLKTWVRSPHRFHQPVKYGLYHCFVITDEEAEEWSVLE